MLKKRPCGTPSSILSHFKETSLVMDNIVLHIESDNTVIIANKNTTIGYATVDADAGFLSYIFVHPNFRRKGYGKMLFEAAETAADAKLRPASPISPLGRKFFARLN